MWLVEDVSRNISTEVCQYSCSNIAIKVNICFSHCKSMANLSCQRNKTAIAIAMKNSIFIEVGTKIFSVKFKHSRPHSF